MWLQLASTALGALIALSGALIVSIRSGRDLDRRELEAQRRQAYVTFATALDAAHAGLRAVLGDPEVGDRRRSSRRAVGEAGLYRAREQLLMFSSRRVAKAGEAAFLALIGVRDVVGRVPGLDTPTYHEAYHVLANALWQFRLTVREDVGERPLAPEDFDQMDWSERNECQVCSARDRHPGPS